MGVLSGRAFFELINDINKKLIIVYFIELEDLSINKLNKMFQNTKQTQDMSTQSNFLQFLSVSKQI